MKHALIVFILSSCFLSACDNSQNSHEATKKNAATNNQKMRDFYEKVMNAHDPSMIDSFISSGYMEHQTDPMYPNTVEGLKARFKDLFIAYPDFHVNVNFVFSHADTVVAETTISGTNSGPMAGMAPTNKHLNIDDIDVVRMVDGKAAEHWGFAEEMKMMQQLGLMPPPGATTDTSKTKM